MRATPRFRTISIVFALFLPVWVGCGGAPVGIESADQTPVASTEVDESPGTAASPADVPSKNANDPATTRAAESPDSAAPKTAEQAVPESADGPEVAPAQMTPAPAATAAQTKRLIDLRDLPRLEVKQLLDEQASYVYYAARSTVSAADAFYQALLGKQGWQVLPTDYPATEDYADTSFERDGFHLRVSIGKSGEEGEVGVSLASLGNGNMMLLPRIEGAELHQASTPRNSNYTTRKAISDVASFCREEFPKHGWRECHTGTANPISVPHYASVSFVKAALRVDVSISKDPRNMSDPTTVAYMAQSVLPYDLPLLQPDGAVMIDTYSGKAAYASTASVSELVEFYRKPSADLGWTYRDQDSAVSEKSASLMVEDEPDLGFAVSIHSAEANTNVQFQRLTFKEPESLPESSIPAVGNVAETSPPKNDVADAVNQAQQEIEALLRSELEKVGGDLEKLGGLDLGNLLNDTPAAEAPDSPSPSATPVTPSEVATAGPDTATCLVKLGDASFTFRHGIAFQALEFDEPVTVIMMCDKPIPRDRLVSLLGKEDRPGFFELFRFEMPNSIEVVLSEHFTNVNCYVDGSSISIGSTEVRNETKMAGGRIRGSVSLPEPHEVFDKPFLFEMNVDLAVLTEKDAPPNPNPGQLTVDPTYEELIPDGTTSFSREASRYRSVVMTTIEEAPQAVLEFYRREMEKRDSKPEPGSTADRLTFATAEGTTVVSVSREGDETLITLVQRNEAKAKADDMLPPKGRSRFILGNATEQDVVIQIGAERHTIGAGVGAEDPATAIRVDVAPGKHEVSIQVPGKAAEGESVAIDAGSTWGIIVIPDLGYFAEQMY